MSPCPTSCHLLHGGVGSEKPSAICRSCPFHGASSNHYNTHRTNCVPHLLRGPGALQGTIQMPDASPLVWHLHGEEKVKVKSLSRVRLFATPLTIARQAPLSMGFSTQEYWSGLPFPFPVDLPDPGIERRPLVLQAAALPSEPPGKPKGE